MFFSLEMRNGFLHVFYDFGFSNGPVHLEDTLKKAQINDAKYHEVQIIAVWVVFLFYLVLFECRSIDPIRCSTKIGGKVIKVNTKRLTEGFSCT